MNWDICRQGKRTHYSILQRGQEIVLRKDLEKIASRASQSFLCPLRLAGLDRRMLAGSGLGDKSPGSALRGRVPLDGLSWPDLEQQMEVLSSRTPLRIAWQPQVSANKPHGLSTETVVSSLAPGGRVFQCFWELSKSRKCRHFVIDRYLDSVLHFI